MTGSYRPPLRSLQKLVDNREAFSTNGYPGYLATEWPGIAPSKGLIYACSRTDGR